LPLIDAGHFRRMLAKGVVGVSHRCDFIGSPFDWWPGQGNIFNWSAN